MKNLIVLHLLNMVQQFCILITKFLDIMYKKYITQLILVLDVLPLDTLFLLEMSLYVFQLLNFNLLLICFASQCAQLVILDPKKKNYNLMLLIDQHLYCHLNITSCHLRLGHLVLVILPRFLDGLLNLNLVSL